MAILTPEQKQAYLEGGMNFCPFCHSENIEYEMLTSQDDAVWQPVSCLDCGEEWNDVYSITGVDTPEEIDGPSDDDGLTARELCDKYAGGDPWGEHPEYPRQEWCNEAGANNTNLGYWEWVAHQLESEEEEEAEADDNVGDDLCDTCGRSGVVCYETDEHGNTVCVECAAERDAEEA